MEFQIIEKYEGFCALENDWEDLLCRIESPQVFYKFQWAKNYLEYYSPEWKNLLCTVVGYENKKLIVLFPFVLEKGVIRFITSKTTDYNMVYVDNSVNRFSTMKKGIEYLLENKKIERFYLNGVLGSSVLYLIEEILREINYSVYIEESIMTPTISVKANAENKFSKERMRGILRKERKLQREHITEIKFRNILSDESLEFIVKHKTHKYNDSALKQENVMLFYEHLCKSLEKETYVSELYVDGNLAAVHLGFHDDNKVYYYIPTYDEAYSKFDVGLSLLYRMIEQELECREFDFLKGNEEYKFYFCDEAGMIFNLLAFKKGTAYTIMQRAMNALKNNHFIRKMMGR